MSLTDPENYNQEKEFLAADRMLECESDARITMQDYAPAIECVTYGWKGFLMNADRDTMWQSVAVFSRPEDALLTVMQEWESRLECHAQKLYKENYGED